MVESTGTATVPPVSETSVLSEIFLRRLKRSLLLRFYTDSLLSSGDRQLLDRVIYSTLCDCQAALASDQAQILLNEARTGVGLFRQPSPPAGGKRA